MNNIVIKNSSIHSAAIIRFYLLVSLLVEIVDFIYGSEERIVSLILQSTSVCIGFYYMVLCIVFRKNNIFSFFFILFILYLGIYAAFSPYFFSNYVTLLRGLLCFFPFYYYSLRNKIRYNDISFFAIALIVISIIRIFLESEIMDDYGERIQSNLGYTIALAMPLLLFQVSKKRNIFMCFVAYFFVLYSMKRGAIICSTLFLFFVVYYMFKDKKFKNMRWKVLFSLTIIMIVAFLTLSDYIISRFNEDGGSGRDIFYGLIWDNWLNNYDITSKLFGNGFFSVQDYLELHYFRAYAHSDWLELLHDHGIVGIMFYSLLLIILIRNILKLKKDKLMLLIGFSVVIVWMLKSIYSGVYVSKGSYVLFMSLGIILGLIRKPLKNIEK